MHSENITCLIVDDQNKFRTFLTGLLVTHFPEVKILGEASSVSDAYAQLKTLNPDIIFLDVELGGQTGFDLVSTLQADEELPLIIFVTGHSNYAIDAIKVAAFDYLLKPVDIVELHKTITKVKIRLEEINILEKLDLGLSDGQNMTSKLSVPVSDGTEFISLNEIIMFRAVRNYTEICLKSGKTIVASKTLKIFEELVPKSHFFKTHRSYIVNILEIKSYRSSDGGFIVMSNDEHANLSSGNKDKLFLLLKKLGKV